MNKMSTGGKSLFSLRRLVLLKSLEQCTGHNRCQAPMPEAAYGPLTTDLRPDHNQFMNTGLLLHLWNISVVCVFLFRNNLFWLNLLTSFSDEKRLLFGSFPNFQIKAKCESALIPNQREKTSSETLASKGLFSWRLWLHKCNQFQNSDDPHLQIRDP